MSDIVYNKNGVAFDIDAIATDLNGKMDRDGLNALASVCVESYVNGTSGYRVYSDGYCVQWGYVLCPNTVTFLKPFANANISTSAIWDAVSAGTTSGIGVRDLATTGCKFVKPSSQSSEDYAYWQASGYIR